MKLLEQLARGMCEKAGHNPDRLVFPHTLEEGPRGLKFAPDRNQFQPLWHFYVPDARAALDLLKELVITQEE